MTTQHGHTICSHDDVIKWKHFPRYWPFVRGIYRSPVNSPHKGQWRGPLMFSLICAWINGWVNNREAGYMRRHRAHYDVTVMLLALRVGTPPVIDGIPAQSYKLFIIFLLLVWIKFLAPSGDALTLTWRHPTELTRSKIRDHLTFQNFS